MKLWEDFRSSFYLDNSNCAKMAYLSSSLPSPTFFNNVDQLSTKKDRGVKRRKPPPNAPSKTCPLISRIFRVHHVPSRKALAVSFQNADTSIASKHYDESRSETYFDQCFVIVSTLGTGSFGEVFKVRSKEDNKYYAVKKSRVPFRGESDRLRKLEEVKKHEQLPNHSNCIQFVKAWEEQQHLYIQTELCERSLSDFTYTNHDVPEKLVWRYLVDLLLAVKHLHDHNLAHMDIKPDNIFISKNGICKIGDFGLVLDLTKRDDSEAIEGDPKYLAPELMEGEFTKAADIFSLGITILELACDLDLPMGGSAWHDLRQNRIPTNFIMHLSQDLKQVICEMMTADYTLRPQVDTILEHHAIRRVLDQRRSVSFLKRFISSVAAVTFAVVAAFQLIFLWVSHACVNLVNKRDFRIEDANDDNCVTVPCWKPPPSESELAFSDDEGPDENRPSFEMFSDSFSNLDDRPSHSTPVFVRHRNSAQKNTSLKSDLSCTNSFSLNCTSNGYLSALRQTPSYVFNEDRNDSTFLRRNLTEVFDSISDED